ncbi:hypothetical protein [Natrialba taiwanensis]|uniref:hypothetical protein n=1 Tax=Natrialba taiwanensis TaxID=160846 RepID=UPI00135F109C|nr:hypothetical protein [Natrialba taiwanensis]
MSLPLNVSIVPMISTTPPSARHAAAIVAAGRVLESVAGGYLAGNGLIGGRGRDR